jgi:hypothetical protein
MVFKFPRTKVIEYRQGRDGKILCSDDPSYPYKLEMRRRHPEFLLLVASVGMYGASGEYILVRGASVRALKRFMRKCGLRPGDRLLDYYTITGPNGVIERFPAQ